MTALKCEDSQLFLAIQPALLRQALALCHSRDHARDLVQETMIRAWSHWAERPHAPAALRAWLATILRNAFFSECRRLAVRRRAAQRLQLADFLYDESALAQSRGHAEALRDFAGPRVNAALLRLPVAMQTLVTLVDLDGLTYQEAAQVLKCPLGTVMSRLHRARARLRVLLGQGRQPHFSAQAPAN